MIIDGKYNCGSIFDSISSFHLPSSAFPQYLLLNGPVQRTLKEITNCETYFDNKPWIHTAPKFKKDIFGVD